MKRGSIILYIATNKLLLMSIYDTILQIRFGIKVSLQFFQSLSKIKIWFFFLEMHLIEFSKIWENTPTLSFD